MSRDEAIPMLCVACGVSPASADINVTALYSIVDKLIAASKREWIGLTDEEFNDCLVKGDPCENLAEPEAWAVMREVEAKLKEKNHT